MQRISLIAGLALTVLALAAVGLMPESGLRNARQTLIVRPPDSPAGTDIPQAETLVRPFDQLTAFSDSGAMPVIGLVIAMVIAAVLGALMTAYLTPPAGAPVTPAHSGRIIAAAFIMPVAACILLLCAIPAVLVLGWQHASEKLGRPGQAAVSIEWPHHIPGNDYYYLRIDWAYRSAEAGSAQPLTSFADLFGPDNPGEVNVTLSGDGFEIFPDEDYNQPVPIDRDDAFWLWEISPEPGTTGPRTLTATIDGTWGPVGGQTRPNTRTLARISLPVTVGDPPITAGMLIVPTMLAALAGPLLCIPWLNGFFRRRLGRASPG